MNELLRRAREAAEGVDADEVVRLTQTLVRIPSYYPGPGEAPVVAYLKEYLTERGFKTEVQSVVPGRPNLIADVGTGAGGLILEGHTDVVTHGSEAAWTHPPYEGVIEKGRLFGRGSNDMKGGLSAAIVAAQAVKKVLGEPQRKLRLAILSDEEGMMQGVKAFVQGGYAESFAGAIICEPEENKVCLWQKGALRIRVAFTGRMAHGAMPYAGANPIPAAAQFINYAREIEMSLQTSGSHPHLGLPYITPTVLTASAGEGQYNVIPDSAEIRLDVRTLPSNNHEAIELSLRDALQQTLEQLDGISGELEVFENKPATETPREAAVVRATEQALELLDHPVVYGGVPGATDGTFLNAWAGLPIVTIGPGDVTVPHQVDEFVDVAELVKAARIYAALAVLMLEREDGL